jgi:pimeloyl-ACP methyl ester carboxylesterase
MLGRPLTPDRAELDALIFNAIGAPTEREALFARQVPESSRAGFQIAFGRVAVDASRVRCPVLSVVAELDRLVAPEVGAQIAEKYRGELLSFRGCGHYALVAEEGWEARAEALVEWLEKRSPRP